MTEPTARTIDPITLDEEIAFDREYVRRFGLWGFVQLAWHLVEPAYELVPNWHLEEMCSHCQAMSEGRWLRGVINIPPGHGKSLIVSVFWPAWSWIDQPALRFMFSSNDDAIALRDAARMKLILCSDWFRARWPGISVIGGEHAANRSFENTDGGYRISAPIRGGFVGKHADIQVCDDPHKPINVINSKSGADLEFVKNWWSGTMASRHRDPKTGRRLIVMQRLHEDDLAGDCLAQGYEGLILPVHFDPERASRTSVGGDRRTKEGELLFGSRYPADVIAKLMRELGDHASAQYEQEPTGKSGGPIKREHFRYWRRLPDFFDVLCWSWDCAFKDKETSDFVCGQLWGRAGPNFFLLWRVNEKLTFPATLQTIQEMQKWSSEQFGRPHDCIIEDKANGTAVIQVLKDNVPGIIEVNPLGGKLARAQGCSFLFRAGNVFFPNPALEGYEWSKNHAETVRKFPRVKKDDTVDAMTQALLYMASLEGGMVSAIGSFIRFGQERGELA